MPKITVILSVLNEEHNIQSALNSLLNLDYPQLEIIIVNDRSTDSTPEILDTYKKDHPHIHVHHIQHLPDGWFGKNHAMHYASQHANGDWLLFTDADVTMKRDTLKKAISYAQENKLDHLTIHELLYQKDFWLVISLLGNYFGYTISMRPWRVRYSWSKKALGRGAFNLVKKSAYLACGGHQSIALECLDDLKLGELLKKNGYQQDVVNAQDYVEFKWYSSLKAMVLGLEKNSFAYFQYKLLPAMTSIVFALTFFIWPIIAVILFPGWVRSLNLAIILLTLYMHIFIAKEYYIQKRYAIFYPFAMIILTYTVLNSILSIYKNKGVIWRGTHYPLKKLKE